MRTAGRIGGTNTSETSSGVCADGKGHLALRCGHLWTGDRFGASLCRTSRSGLPVIPGRAQELRMSPDTRTANPTETRVGRRFTKRTHSPPCHRREFVPVSGTLEARNQGDL